MNKRFHTTLVSLSLITLTRHAACVTATHSRVISHHNVPVLPQLAVVLLDLTTSITKPTPSHKTLTLKPKPQTLKHKPSPHARAPHQHLNPPPLPTGAAISYPAPVPLRRRLLVTRNHLIKRTRLHARQHNPLLPPPPPPSHLLLRHRVLLRVDLRQMHVVAGLDGRKQRFLLLQHLTLLLR